MVSFHCEGVATVVCEEVPACIGDGKQLTISVGIQGLSICQGAHGEGYRLAML